MGDQVQLPALPTVMEKLATQFPRITVPAQKKKKSHIFLANSPTAPSPVFQSSLSL